MSTLIESPKSDYLLQPHPSDLHNEATEWISDLEFCKTELIFLNKLLDKSFLKTKGKERLADLLAFEKKIRFFRANTLKSIHSEVIVHERHLASLDENVFAQDEQSIREEHERINTSVNAFMGTVRKIKKEIFDFVEKELFRTNSDLPKSKI
jgi:hypothetical protein